MNAEQIIKAIDMGERVYWSHLGYEVKLSHGEYTIEHEGGYIVGLTWTDGVTLNGKEEDFFIWHEREIITDKLVENDITTIKKDAEIKDYSYLNNVLRGDGFTQYNEMTIHELNNEWQEVFLFNLFESEGV